MSATKPDIRCVENRTVEVWLNATETIAGRIVTTLAALEAFCAELRSRGAQDDDEVEARTRQYTQLSPRFTAKLPLDAHGGDR